MSSDELLKQIDDIIAKVEILKNNDSNEALKLALNALELSKEINYPEAEAILLLKIGTIYKNLFEYMKGIEYITAAIPMLELYSITYHLCAAYCILGNIFYELANYDTAFTYYNESANIAKKHQFKDRLSTAYNNVGEIYKVLLIYDKALEYYQKSLDEDMDKDLIGRGITYINLAEIHFLMGDYETALEFVPIGFSILKKYSYEIFYCEVYRIYALIYWKLSNYDHAKEYFYKAIEIADQQMTYNYKIEILIGYHQFLAEQKLIEPALEALSDAYSLAVANNLNEKCIQICKHFIITFEETEDLESVLKYYRLYNDHDQQQSKTRNHQISDAIDLRVKADENKLNSEIDALTGIGNRRKFLQFLHNQWSYSKKYALSIAVIIIDVDCFKEFNDNYGHLEGDKCLIEIAKIMDSITAKKHTLCRYGGDEFIAVLTVTTSEEAFNLAENLRQSVQDAKIRHESSVVSDYVTITLGVSSIIPDDDILATDLIKKADDALYEAKRKGRNKVISG